MAHYGIQLCICTHVCISRFSFLPEHIVNGGPASPKKELHVPQSSTEAQPLLPKSPTSSHPSTPEPELCENPFVRVTNLSASWSSEDRERLVLQDISFEVNEDSNFLAVMGPVGCGKVRIRTNTGWSDNILYAS